MGGLSPFTSEKTPSFFVNDQKGFFHDFSSGKHGDIFAFVMETEGLISGGGRAAGRNGGRSDAAPERRRGRRRQEAREPDRGPGDGRAMFEANLQQPIGARRAAISPTAASAPRCSSVSLGYASSERFHLRDALAAKGVGAEQMIEAGLLSTARTSPSPTTGSATG